MGCSECVYLVHVGNCLWLSNFLGAWQEFTIWVHNLFQKIFIPSRITRKAYIKWCMPLSTCGSTCIHGHELYRPIVPIVGKRKYLYLPHSESVMKVISEWLMLLYINTGLLSDLVAQVRIRDMFGWQGGRANNELCKRFWVLVSMAEASILMTHKQNAGTHMYQDNWRFRRLNLKHQQVVSPTWSCFLFCPMQH